jgi:preprotein translocase subunit YajC
LSILHFLADGATSQPTQQVPVPFWANPPQILMLAVFAVVMFILLNSSKSKRNDQRQRDEMLKNMKRGDRVMTAGGILGTVVDVRDTEVVLKVDESTNTKIKFSREAIKRVLTDDEPAAAK